jgi:hypothetical protein
LPEHDERAFDEPATQKLHPLTELLRHFYTAAEWLFGLVCLIGGLAFLSALPIVQFLSLGYLLESGARVARSGRMRDGFIGVRTAARLGGIVVASWLLILPVRLLADLAQSAEIIDPGSPRAAMWRSGVWVLAGATLVHIVFAVARGGKLRYFLWPFNFISLLVQLVRGGLYTRSRDAVWDTVVALRLPYYFWLGVRGFAAAFVWLALPVTLLALGRMKAPIAPLIGFIGAFWLALVLIYLPFLQLRMAMRNRFAVAFHWCAVRRAYKRAPWAFAIAFFITLLFAVPLYLFKIEAAPKEAAWLPGLFFIAFIWPARLLTGWALGRSRKRRQPRHWFFRITGRIPFVPLAAIYVLIVFFTQYTSWNGVWSLYEQHAFLLPVPFIGG